MISLPRLLRSLADELGGDDKTARDGLNSDLRSFVHNECMNMFARPGMYVQTSGELESMLWIWLRVIEWTEDRDDIGRVFRSLLAKRLRMPEPIAETRGLPLKEAAEHLNAVFRQIWDEDL